MLHKPFFDPLLSYDENYKKGPFGEFANKKVFKQKGTADHYLFGLPLFLPFGIPAGPLLNSKFAIAALDKGFDLVEYKTVRTGFRPSNEWPNVLAVKVKGNLTLKMAEKGVIGNQKYGNPLSVTNSFGVPSMDPDVWQPDLKKAVKYAKEGQVVIGSFQGTTNKEGNVIKYIKDFVKATRLVKETGVKVLEVNLSCPNEGAAHLLCFDLKRSADVVHAIKNEIGDTPLIIKIAYFEDEGRLKKLVHLVGHMVDGISAINTIPAKVYDEKGNQALPGGPARLYSGTCGHPIKWAGLEMVRRLKKLRKELGLSFAIIGVGGVTEPSDYFEYRKMGADAVMSATGAMWNPFLAQEIKKKVS
ncbi:MAG: dihydroorotate oxidase [Patescibacteria group bacterium]